jgi:hypothetical protein
MDDEAKSTVINDDQTDIQSQTGKKVANSSRHSSRVGSTRSDRSRPVSDRDLPVDNEHQQRKASSTVEHVPNADDKNIPHRQTSADIKREAMAINKPINDDYRDDVVTPDDIEITADFDSMVK